jgi:uncharacterized DUF497 family protein
MRIDWDDGKAVANLAKHGVSFYEAATVLGDPLGWTYPDPEHSTVEERWLTVGMSERQRILVVAHTIWEAGTRIISARPATRKERRFYEEG